MIDARFSEDIEVGAKCRPKFSTDMIPTDGGWVVTNSRWRYPKHQFEFNAAPGEKGEAIIDEVIDMFWAAGGSADTFLFHHWADGEATDQAMEAVDGSTTIYQLMKNYTRGSTTRQRKITRPVDGTVAIYVNAIPVLSGFTVDYETGQVTFLATPAATPTADFEFDVPVRFADDEIEILALTRELQQPVSIVLIEDKE